MTELDLQQRAHLEALDDAYARALATHGFDGVLIYSGHPACHFGDDQHASFSAYGHFLHWTGQSELADSWLLILPGHSPTLYLHAPTDFWHLPARLPGEPWIEHFRVVPREERRPPPLPEGRFAVLGDVDPATASALGAELNPATLMTALDERRVRKSAYEVECLREANRRALSGHRAARECFMAGGAEFDIQVAYLGATRQRESALPYPNIVGVNAHGGVLHYQHYALRASRHRRSLLLDGGHRHRGYCADITRTWAGADADPQFTPLIAGVTALQRRLIDNLVPGVNFVALQRRMHEGLAALLVEHGLVTASTEAALSTGITRAFCPHGLGHLLGVQVHDVAGRVAPDGTPLPPPSEHPALRLTRELEPGMVVTMEPGLYIIPMLLEAHRGRPEINWDRVERLADHGGIRIEDNVLVTDRGPDNLTLQDE